eukprot:4174744-Ditylum_brightwellii.AAC.1
MATQEENNLPIGRRVAITRNNLEYRLAMVFADKTLMVHENCIFLNKTDPLFLPNFKNSSPLGELNTGLFYERTNHVLKEYKVYKSENCSDVIPSDGYTPRVVMSFHLCMDGTLVACNSVESISVCPEISSRNIRNLAK